jgi:hypothetical protein
VTQHGGRLIFPSGGFTPKYAKRKTWDSTEYAGIGEYGGPSKTAMDRLPDDGDRRSPH